VFEQLVVPVDIYNSKIDGRNVEAIYLDFTNACDKVPHQRLLLKHRKRMGLLLG